MAPLLPGGDGDPFAGLLERSSVAMALQDARASLARPSRPFTPADRSLFQRSKSLACEDFRSGCASPSGGAAWKPAPLKAKPKLLSPIDTGPLPSLRKPPTPVAASNPLLPKEAPAVSSGKSSRRSASTGSSLRKESGSNSKADILTLPEDLNALLAERLAGADCKPQRPDGKRQDGLNRPPRSRSKAAAAADDKASSGLLLPDSDRATLSSSSGSRSSKAAAAAFAEELEALVTSSKEASAKQLAKLASKLASSGVVDGLKRKPSEAAQRLVRAILQVLSRGAESATAFKLARCALDLLAIDGILPDDGRDPRRCAAAAYASVSRTLFRLSQESSYDSSFKDEGVLERLMQVLESFANGSREATSSLELQVLILGVLKNASVEDANRSFLLKECNALRTVINAMRRPEVRTGGSEEQVQLLIQATAALRNFAGSAESHAQFVELGVFEDMTRISALCMDSTELQVNIARVLGELSLHDGPCEAFAANPEHLKQVVRSLQAHAEVPSLVLRLAFTLGNVTAGSDKMRDLLMLACDGVQLLPSLLATYWRKDRELVRSNSGRAVGSSACSEAQTQAAEECEQVLVKLVRLVANVSINPAIGDQLSAAPNIADPLLDIMGCKRITNSEELVLNATAAITNLLFYDSSANLLFSSENKELLCRLLRPMVLEAFNVEALVEAARAFGNLSRHADARKLMVELRIEEVLCILLAHGERDLVFYACGALVNLVCDRNVGRRLCSLGGSEKQPGLRAQLGELLREGPEYGDWELALVAVKVLSNLCHGEEQPWEPEEIEAVKESLQDCISAAELGLAGSGEGEVDGPPKSLVDLATNVLVHLPPFEVAGVDQPNGKDMLVEEA
eukprot:TRINITY_DN111893_c0_g1_i1.p1 TRINITY_DN111893_c0_g1~~TRINITY_DN111893_c0_g1_i1.p1  ORF type:complete len:856 (-),score=276.77 TRINITY_DN111893_c0_g1_i1:68-2635(-)